MPLQTSGELSLDDIRMNIFQRTTGPIGFNDLYKQTTSTTPAISDVPENASVPTSGTISLQNLRGAATAKLATEDVVVTVVTPGTRNTAITTSRNTNINRNTNVSRSTAVNRSTAVTRSTNITRPTGSGKSAKNTVIGSRNTATGATKSTRVSTRNTVYTTRSTKVSTRNTSVPSTRNTSIQTTSFTTKPVTVTKRF